MEAGHYSTVIGDARSAEGANYSLLKRALALSCPVPFLVSHKSGDAMAVSRLLTQGALDMVRYSRDAEAAHVVRRALWLYQVRLIVHNRRHRLEEYRLRHACISPPTSEQRKRLVEQTIRDIDEANRLCDRTIHQIESSLRVLENICLQAESEARECAIRLTRYL